MKKLSSKQIFAETLQELAVNTPIDKITVKQIVDESGLSLQTFYNHFQDKADLVLWVHKSEGDRLISRLEEDEYSFHDLIRDNVRFFADHKDFLLNAYANSHGFESYELRATENAYRVLSDYLLKKKGLDVLPEEIQIQLRMYITGSNRGYLDWQTRYPEIPEETFVRYLEDACPEKLRSFILGTQDSAGGAGS